MHFFLWNLQAAQAVELEEEEPPCIVAKDIRVCFFFGDLCWLGFRIGFLDSLLRKGENREDRGESYAGER